MWSSRKSIDHAKFLEQFVAKKLSAQNCRREFVILFVAEELEQGSATAFSRVAARASARSKQCVHSACRRAGEACPTFAHYGGYTNPFLCGRAPQREGKCLEMQVDFPW